VIAKLAVTHLDLVQSSARDARRCCLYDTCGWQNGPLRKSVDRDFEQS
jgi:hypothetical protein